MNACRTLALALALAVAAVTHAQSPPAQSPPAQSPPAPPPNLVVVDPRIVTPGQPLAAWLERLKANGFEAVVYLAPSTVPDAVRDETLIVSRQGLVYVNIPIAFEGPTDRDFEAFAGAMRALASRKVLVHCQVNMRASLMTYLYRTVVRKEDPASAFDAVAAVWSPYDPWRSFARTLLARHGIAFELY